ncbi:protein of unknown function (DUF4483) [Carpediemonas membranifera]|uniref:Uncharacterized protein n=1 Tax=Carpediemonas membranifera TaxID=201153 RepID=A0A8J6AZ37_9EUKA|nr:protein of unknown function (DUF4483) [Carpediemonas membranifera]|eukprot:KAG9394950.1 protein of unknown function (DUF4483) [Carpediemonas membranifera]
MGDRYKYNHLLQKRDVGAPMVTREPPPADFVHGAPPRQRKFIDTAHAAVIWDEGDTRANDRAPKKTAGHNNILSRNIRLLSKPDPRTGKIPRVSSASVRDMRLPHQKCPEHTYGKQGATDTPVKAIVEYQFTGDSYGEPHFRTASPKLHAGSTLKEQQSRSPVARTPEERAVDSETMFKMTKFQRTPSRISRYHRNK